MAKKVDYEERIQELCFGGKDLKNPTSFKNHSYVRNHELSEQLWAKFDNDIENYAAKLEMRNCTRSDSSFVLHSTPDVEEVYSFMETVYEGRGTCVDIVIHRKTNQAFYCRTFYKTTSEIVPQDRQKLFCAIRKEFCMYLMAETIPCISTIYKVYENENFVYAMFDFYPRGDLEQYLMKKPEGVLEGVIKDEIYLRKLFLSMCQCVFPFAYDGLTHGSLGADVFYINEDITIIGHRSKPKALALLDLGQVKNKYKQKHAYTRNTEWLYTAPETFLGRPKSPAADVWALGIILYMSYFGCPPFISFEIRYKDFVGQIKENVLKGFKEEVISGKGPHFPKENKCSPLLKDLLGKMLRKDEKERITLYEIFNHPWVLTGNYKEVLFQNLADAVYLFNRVPEYVREILLCVMENEEDKKCMPSIIKDAYFKIYNVFEVEDEAKKNVIDGEKLADALVSTYPHLTLEQANNMIQSIIKFKNARPEKIVFKTESEEERQPKRKSKKQEEAEKAREELLKNTLQLDLLIYMRMACDNNDISKRMAEKFSAFDPQRDAEIPRTQFKEALQVLGGKTVSEENLELITRGIQKAQKNRKNANYKKLLQCINNINNPQSIASEIQQQRFKKF